MTTEQRDAQPSVLSPQSAQRERVVALMRGAQADLIAAFETLDGGTFGAHTWERPGGGGGTARILEGGEVLERAGVNVSAVYGERVPESLSAAHPGTEGKPFFATGLSLVLHPRNPYVPAFHANYRYFEIGEGDAWWFGGGADMTPNYLFEEDVRHFHGTLRAQCERHGVAYGPLKETCDRYFYLPHRGEMRGVGGIFFDQLEERDFARAFAFAQDGLGTLQAAYLPIARRRQGTPYGELERAWQLYRRGRYAEFNLVYDRGTRFGLQTNGNTEAILMSLPPLAAWRFDFQPEPGSPEADMVAALQPRDWV